MSAAINPWAGLRYGALGLPLAFVALPLYVVLPSHYAAHYGVALSSLGGVLLVTRVLDALLDPFIGQWVDHVFAGSNRAAWRLAAVAATALGVGFAALFHPQVLGDGLLVWLAGGLLLTYTAFSVLTVVHQAWGARLGGDAVQRSRIVAWREGCGLVGVLLASVLPSQAGLDVTTVVLLAALAVGTGLLARAPQAAPEPAAPGRRGPHEAPELRDWALPWRSARFRRLLAVFMLNGIARAVPATLVLFFVRDGLQAPGAEPLILGTYFAAAVVSVPVWVKVVRRCGLALAWLAGMGLAVLAFACVPAVGPGNVAGFLAVCVASGLALGADLTIPGALLTGVVQHAGHSAQAEGVYVGWWNSATKLNLGLAAGGALPLLALAGYAPGQREPQALQALVLGYVAIPCALKLLAAVLLWRLWASTRGDT
ncbi:MAG TPA: MFS transporter [Rhizobacter sp.]|nr:MFS transporter [Rhizobacter sp.]